MSNINDFVIENGVLTKYIGNDTEVVIPDGVKVIGNFAFESDSPIIHVVVPRTVTKIGHNAFWRCKSLKSIKINGLIKEIGESAFEGCTNLREVRLPDTLKSIGKNAFKDCPNLVSKYQEDNDYNSGRLYLPNVTSIGDNAFENDLNTWESEKSIRFCYLEYNIWNLHSLPVKRKSLSLR